MVAWDDRKDDQSPWMQFMGKHPIGFLIYDPTGFMSIQIMKTLLLPPFPIEDGQFVVASDDAKAVVDGYLAYFGRYSVDEAKQVVIHYVEGSLLPNIVGTYQEWKISIEGECLIFGDEKTWRRIFKRVR